MSGPGDIDGEVSGDEAAWRDLIARFDVPTDRTGAGVPWPDSEDLPDASDSRADSSGDGSDHGSSAEDGARSTDPRTRPAEPNRPADRTARPTDRGGRQSDHGARPGDRSARPSDHKPRLAKHAADWPAIDAGPSDRPAGQPKHRSGPADRSAGPAGRPASPAGPSDASTAAADYRTGAGGDGRTDTTSAAAGDARAEQQGKSDLAAPGSEPLGYPAASAPVPHDRTHVVRPAGDPRSYTPPEEDDERYVPAPLPPPAKMDSVTKAALVGVIGGPGYLLVASVFLNWSISVEAALVAVAAFVAGFVTLVVKLGDRSGRDDDDDGAVL